MGIFGPGKKDLEKQVDELNEKLSKINLTIEQTKYLDLSEEIDKLNKEKLYLQDKKSNLEQKVDTLQSSLIYLNEIDEMQSFGFYEPKYNFENSSFYKTKLESIRSKQKEMVKSKTATIHSLTWTMDNDKKKGKEFILDTIKLILRAFNNECDNIISKVKFNNVDASDNKIQKVYTDLNKLTDVQRVSIKSSYLKLKQEELYLKYEYECKLQEEKEEQQAIKEQMREEAKVAKELEVARKKVEKEETHFSNAIKDLNNKIQNSSDKEKNILLDKLKELEAKLAEIEKSKQDLVNREQNTRAGYVYIISNIGSFGKNIYKIGMTRRLEPMDRVRELGDASVPFKFDVHAMIFSENAPTLENALHKKFANKSVNKINLRKEFFNVSLSEIKNEIEKNHNATIEFTMIAEAVEYRQSLSIENKKSNTVLSSDPVNKSFKFKEINIKQNQALELIRDMLSKLTNKEDITYKINGDTFDILHKDNSDNWICRLFLDRKGQKGIHIPDENKNAIMFDFDEIEDLKDIKDMLQDIVKRYL